ncbi:MAG TPA: hypothetical protein VFQ85_17940 [Mycobacteriales bacterium]|nr:hypothetical protein [Mycobacteriales bacterium]
MRAWVRLLGLYAECFELVVPAPPEAVLAAFMAAARDHRVRLRDMFRPVRPAFVRRGIRGGVAVRVVSPLSLTGHPQLFLRVAPAPEGTRVRAEVRHRRWVQVLGGAGLTLLALACVASTLAVVPVAFVGGARAAALTAGAALALGVGFEVARVAVSGVGLPDRALLRAWCHEVAGSAR